MAEVSGHLQAARTAYRQRDWVTARASFEAAREAEPLGPDDLFALAACDWWLGEIEVSLPLQMDAHRLLLADGRSPDAAMAAILVGYTLTLRGEEAQGSGWMARATRLLENEPERAEHGYVAYVDFEQALEAADPEAALAAARRVEALGRRFDDASLRALGAMGTGRVLLRRGEVREAVALLDEAMLAALTDDLDPVWAGNIYCHLMEACDEIVDLRRAREWTQATADWCRRMPGAGPFMGICRVHRAQVMSVEGAWDEAEREVVRVCEELRRFDVPVVAEAHYQLGELRRKRGDLAGAQAAYRDGHRLGRDPQPGLALVRLARGEIGLAAASLRSALAGVTDGVLARARLLPAAVEVELAANDLSRARAASTELDEIATTYGTAGLMAQSCHAHGAVHLAADEADRALTVLRRSVALWQELGATHEAARVRRLLARTYEALDDPASAALESQAAAAMSADPPAAVAPSALPRASGLTPREAEVVALVAAGLTNQQIAGQLVLSVRTVERHLATVYQKLGFRGRNARAAVVGFALREGLAGMAATTQAHDVRPT